MRVGDLIKQKRTEKNMTQEQLGELLGVNRAAINKWETGRVTNLKRETIKRLSEIFEISPALLVEPDSVDSYSSGFQSTSPVDEVDRELLSLFSRLSKDQQQQVLDYLRFLLSKP